MDSCDATATTTSSSAALLGPDLFSLGLEGY